MTNTSPTPGIYAATLWINNLIEDAKQITVEGGKTELVEFLVTRSQPGTYQVRIERQLGSFESKPVVVPTPTAIATPTRTATPTATRTPPPTPKPVVIVKPTATPRPAAWSVTNLVIQPPSPSAGQPVEIKAAVTNTGEAEDTYTATLTINGVVEARQAVKVAGGASATVAFTVKRDAPGDYQVALDGLTAKFSIAPGGIPWVWIAIGLVVLAILVGGAWWFARRKPA